MTFKKKGAGFSLDLKEENRWAKWLYQQASIRPGVVFGRIQR
jgi:hypothetical protein